MPCRGDHTRKFKYEVCLEGRRSREKNMNKRFYCDFCGKKWLRLGIQPSDWLV